MPHSIIGPGSIDRRPDSFSWSYLTTFTFGPIGLGDFSVGSVDRVWKVRCDGNNVYAQRQATADTYDPEIFIFSFDGAPATEIDAAFDQQAHIFVCAERPTALGGGPEIWIYYFDPLASAFTFTMFARGRTPRALLDDARDTNNADVLMFYMNDDRNQMCYRQQRDRYAIEYDVNEATGGALTSDILGPILDSDFSQGGTRVLTSGAEFPPYPHLNETVTLGDFQYETIGDYTYQIIFQFSEPIKEFNLSMYYPIPFSLEGGTKMYMDAVVDDSQFSMGPNGQIYTFAARAFFDDVQGSRKTLSYLSGFQFVIIGTMNHPMPPGNYTPPFQTFGDVTRAPTFGDATFKLLRDVLTAAPVPVTSHQRYIEDVYKAIDSRVHVLYSERNPATGRFELAHVESVLYPQFLDVDEFTAATSSEGGLLEQIILPVGPIDSPDPVNDPSRIAFLDMPAFVAAAISLQPGGLLVQPLIDVATDPADATWKASSVSVQSGILAQPLIVVATDPAADGTWKAVGVFLQSGTLVVVLIVQTLFDINTWQAASIRPIATGSSLA